MRSNKNYQKFYADSRKIISEVLVITNLADDNRKSSISSLNQSYTALLLFI